MGPSASAGPAAPWPGRAEAFGMRVIAVDPEDVERPTYVAELWKPERFHHLLRARSWSGALITLVEDVQTLGRMT